MPTDGDRDRLVSNALAGTVQTIVSGLMLVLLYRFLLDRLGPGMIGEWSLMLSILGLTRILDFGLVGSGLKLTAESLAGRHFADARSYTRWSIFGTGLLTSPGIVLAVFLAPPLIGAIGAESHFSDLGVLGAMGLAAWLGFILQSLRSAIDSFQRVDLRHLTVAVQALLFLVLCWALVPIYGSQGLVAAFLLGSGATAAFAAVILHRLWSDISPAESITPRSSRAALVRSMVGYGLPFHVTGIASQLYDPLTKYLLGCFGSLAAIAWYEMASRLVLLLRGLLVSAMEALVPYVAKFSIEATGVIEQKYIPALRISLFVGVPLFMALIVASPFISWIWIGSVNSQFIGFLQLLSVAWMINVLSAPAYFFALGLGRQRWNLIAHVLIAVLNLTLSSALGVLFGSIGVVAGFSLAASAGSLLQMMGFHRDRSIGLGFLSWEPAAILSAVTLIFTIVFCFLWWTAPDSMRFIVLTLGAGAAAIVGTAPLLEPAIGRRFRSFLRMMASR